MYIEPILADPKTSMLIVNSGQVQDIVIGVPHHAPLGTPELPCEEHRDADENTGFLGYYVAQLLNCPTVIACNYFIDPNKHRESDYFKRIQSWKPKILTEIHGHGGKSAKFHIEISSGSAERNFWSKHLADRLGKKFADVPSLQGYSISGDINAIYFKAQKTTSIVEKEWVSFHIELPKSLRESKSIYTPFCELLAVALKEIMADFDELQTSQHQNEG